MCKCAYKDIPTIITSLHYPSGATLAGSGVGSGSGSECFGNRDRRAYGTLAGFLEQVWQNSSADLTELSQLLLLRHNI